MPTKLATEIAPGDVLVVDGAELHDDLAGLVVEVPVGEVTRDEDWVVVHHPHRDEKIWWRAGETVRTVR